MLPFLKKPSDKTSTATVPAWHPNFRNFERLPDTKAVRTTFFINGLALLIASSLVIYTGYREFGLRSLQADTDAAQKVVDANKPASDEAIALFKKFQEEEKKVFALQSFLSSSRLVLSDFFLQIGASLPASVTLNSIPGRSSTVTSSACVAMRSIVYRAGADRTSRKNARTSSTNSAGCSKAAKWPPLDISLQCWMLLKFVSIQRRTGVTISRGNAATPVGTPTLWTDRRSGPKLSQYRRADEPAVAVTQ